ncbi:hypothetical protein QQS21_001450 [Conoideocrella luteorostrata]|uniref:Uncharacterized protein n=1 Tax=Conoideocrella luteorostrata TaxID=1105319 RepID=A0AAJ0CWY5_9HYPO|nr:hypothetical protein QQS21_001450 [Conoideocrella luteorostrata]
MDHAVDVPRSNMVPVPVGDEEEQPDISGRVLNCIITAPLVESLHRFEPLPELLYALRDAIGLIVRCTSSAVFFIKTYLPGILLFHHVSKAVMVAIAPKGVLIDLDVSKLAETPSRQFESIGTPLF